MSSSRPSLSCFRTRVSSRSRSRCSSRWRVWVALELLEVSRLILVVAASIRSSSTSSWLTMLNYIRWSRSCLSVEYLKEETQFTRMLSLDLTQRGAMSSPANLGLLSQASRSMVRLREAFPTSLTAARFLSTTRQASMVSKRPMSGRTPSCSCS